MPELPEVESLASQLRNVLCGLRFREIFVRQPLVLRNRPEFLKQACAGQVIEKVVRRGKYLGLEMAAGTLWFHLGMTGQLLWDPESPAEMHTHLIFSFEGRQERLFFRDTRRFGKVFWLGGETADAP